MSLDTLSQAELFPPGPSFWDTLKPGSHAKRYRERLHSQTLLPLTPMEHASGPSLDTRDAAATDDSTSRRDPSSTYAQTEEDKGGSQVPSRDHPTIPSAPLREVDGGMQLHVVGTHSLIVTDDSRPASGHEMLPPAYTDV